MKAWLEVHGEATEAHVAEVAARGRAADGATLTDSVKLLGGASKIDAAMATRKKSRVEVIDALRAAVLKRSGTCRCDANSRSSGVDSTRRARASSTGARSPTACARSGLTTPRTN